MLPTVRNTLPHHPVGATCRLCNRTRTLDLVALEAAGYGDTALTELQLRCQCGSRDVCISVMGAGHGYETRPVPYQS